MTSSTTPKWRTPLFWTIGILALDLLTKKLALTNISPWEPIEIIPGLFNLVLTYNSGTAFGLFASEQGTAQGLKMAALATISLLPFIYFYVKAQREDSLQLVALGLIWGGALGNIYDRFRWGAVVDFLDFYIGKYHWPAFNIADIAICVGAGLLAISILRSKPQEIR